MRKTSEQRAYNRGMRRAAEIARLFANENMRMATDTIMMDPILNRDNRQFATAEEFEAAIGVSNRLCTEGYGHSVRSHTADDIANMIMAEIRTARRKV